MLVHAGLQAVGHVAVQRVCRQRQDRKARQPALRLLLPQPARAFQAVHARHLDVHQHQAGRRVLAQVQRFLAIARELRLQAHQRQEFQRHHLVDRVVLDQQHEGLARGRALAGNRRIGHRGRGRRLGGRVRRHQDQRGLGNGMAVVSVHVACRPRSGREARYSLKNVARRSGRTGVGVARRRRGPLLPHPPKTSKCAEVIGRRP